MMTAMMVFKSHRRAMEYSELSCSNVQRHMGVVVRTWASLILSARRHCLLHASIELCADILL